MKTSVLFALLATSALGAEPVSVYAFCNNAPSIDAPRARELAVRVTRTSAPTEIVDVKVKGAGALRVDKAELPATWLGWFNGAACAESAVEVVVTLRQGKGRDVRTVSVRSVVQQVD